MFLDAALGRAVVSAPMLGNGRNFKKGTSYVRSFTTREALPAFTGPAAAGTGDARQQHQSRMAVPGGKSGGRPLGPHWPLRL